MSSPFESNRLAVLSLSRRLQCLGLCGVVVVMTAVTAEAQTVRRSFSVDSQGRVASSIAIEPQAGGGPMTPVEGVSPYSTGTQNMQPGYGGSSPFSPGVQTTPGTPWGRSTTIVPYNNSVTSPGAQNLPQTGWTQPGTTWTQPQSNWGGTWTTPQNNGGTVWSAPQNQWSGQAGQWTTTPGRTVMSSAPPAPVISSVPGPPVVTTKPVVSPSTQTVTGSVLSLPPSLPQPSTGGNLITIAMPEFEQGTCGYILQADGNNWNYTIRPGKKQQFPQDRGWSIRFDAGGSAGEVSYRLEAGRYEFRRTEAGWNLFRVAAAENGPTTTPPFAPQ